MKKGVLISPVDETNFSLFAPNQKAMGEAQEMIESYLEQQVLFECLKVLIPI
jgi:hypothetical protein